MGEWRDISDRAPIGFTHPYSKRVDAAQFVLVWNGYHCGVGYGETDENNSVQWWGEDGHPIEPSPTHWQLLPSPPKAEND